MKTETENVFVNFEILAVPDLGTIHFLIVGGAGILVPEIIFFFELK